MKKITSFLVAGALVLFMSGCGQSVDTEGGAATLPPHSTASAKATAKLTTPKPHVTADTEPTDSATKDVEPSDDETTQPDDTQTVKPTDDTSTETDDPQDDATSAPTKTPKPTDDSSSTGDDSTSKALTAKSVTGTAEVSDYLSMRASASATAEVVTKIEKDKKFTITGVSKDAMWLKVKYSSKTGYVLAKYVVVNGSSKNKVCMAVSSGSLNVRNGAGTTHKLLGFVKSGTTMVVTSTVKGSPDNWYKVTLSGSTGYVNAKYCRIAK